MRALLARRPRSRRTGRLAANYAAPTPPPLVMTRAEGLRWGIPIKAGTWHAPILVRSELERHRVRHLSLSGSLSLTVCATSESRFLANRLRVGPDSDRAGLGQNLI